MLTLYMQQVLGYSAMKTGVAYLAVAGTAIVCVGVAGAARDAHRRKAGAGDRDDHAHRRPRVLHAGLGRRLLRRPTCCPGSCSSESASASRSCRSRSPRSRASSLQRPGSLRASSTRRSRSAARSGSRRCRRSRRREPSDAIAKGSTPAAALVDGFHGAFVAGVIIAGDRHRRRARRSSAATSSKRALRKFPSRVRPGGLKTTKSVGEPTGFHGQSCAQGADVYSSRRSSGRQGRSPTRGKPWARRPFALAGSDPCDGSYIPLTRPMT